MTNEEMMGMLASKDPCANPPAMSFHPDNPTELAIGEQETLNLIGGVPPYTFEILQTSLFYIDDSFISWPAGFTQDYIKATSNFSVDYHIVWAHIPDRPRHGPTLQNAWISANGQPTNQRVNIDLGEPKIVDQIILENAHESGGSLTHGIKNFDFQGSNDANSMDQLDYSSDQYWTDIQTGLQAAQHSGLNYDDPQIFNITNETAYRYYSLKIADNWGYGTYMGFRHLQLHTSQTKVYKYITDDPQITIKAPDYGLWTPRIKVTDLCSQVAEAWLYCTPGKWDSVYSGSVGGTPTLCGKVNFRAIKNGVMIVCANCNTNGLGTFGDIGYDCSAYGGGSYEVNVSEKCQGGENCKNAQSYEFFCWPYP